MLINQHDSVALLRSFESRGTAGDPGTDDHNLFTHFRILMEVQRLRQSACNSVRF
jgi:hypothetical protein